MADANCSKKLTECKESCIFKRCDIANLDECKKKCESKKKEEKEDLEEGELDIKYSKCIRSCRLSPEIECEKKCDEDYGDCQNDCFSSPDYLAGDWYAFPKCMGWF